MRLWHKDLIPVLPRQQLLGQWRECCLIAKNIAEKGTPGHLLVNRIMDYPLEHFYRYSGYVFAYMVDKGYKCDETKLLMYTDVYSCKFAFWHGEFVALDYLFSHWHNNRYLTQCLYNLEEKHDCEGISDDEWEIIARKYYSLLFEEEYKRGKFVSEIVKKEDWKGDLHDYYQPNSCSVCHTALSGTEHYCYNCGAKMFCDEDVG